MRPGRTTHTRTNLFSYLHHFLYPVAHRTFGLQHARHAAVIGRGSTRPHAGHRFSRCKDLWYGIGWTLGSEDHARCTHNTHGLSQFPSSGQGCGNDARAGSRWYQTHLVLTLCPWPASTRAADWTRILEPCNQPARQLFSRMAKAFEVLGFGKKGTLRCAIKIYPECTGPM